MRQPLKPPLKNSNIEIKILFLISIFKKQESTLSKYISPRKMILQ